MHEISLVRNVFRTLEAEFPEKVNALRSIHLTVGILSNIQPLLMQSALQAVVENEQHQYKNVMLHVDVVPAKVFCSDCNVESVVEQYMFKCNVCGKPSKQVTQGEEMIISKVEFES